MTPPPAFVRSVCLNTTHGSGAFQAGTVGSPELRGVRRPRLAAPLPDPRTQEDLDDSASESQCEPIDAAAAVRLSILHNSTFLRDTIRTAVIRQYAEKQGIRNSDAELQLAADELRYNRSLEGVEATEQWLRANHQTPLAIQDGIDAMLLNNKVRYAIGDEQLQAYYADHKLEYEAAELYSIRLDSESKARELLAQVNDEGADFHTLAREHSQDDNSRHLGGFVGRLTRAQMTGVVAAAVFAPRPAAVIGPVKTDQGWNLFKVAKIHKPTYEESKDRVRVTLMEQLVDKLIAEARIEYPVFEEAAVATA